MGASDAELCGMSTLCSKRAMPSCSAIAFPFPELAEGALVVDVGGWNRVNDVETCGTGSTSYVLLSRTGSQCAGLVRTYGSFLLPLLLDPGAHRPRRHGIFTALP